MIFLFKPAQTYILAALYFSQPLKKSKSGKKREPFFFIVEDHFFKSAKVAQQ